MGSQQLTLAIHRDYHDKAWEKECQAINGLSRNFLSRRVTGRDQGQNELAVFQFQYFS